MEFFFQVQALERIFEKVLSLISSSLSNWLLSRSDELTFVLGLVFLVAALVAPFAVIWFLCKKEQARAEGRPHHFICSIANGGDHALRDRILSHSGRKQYLS